MKYFLYPVTWLFAIIIYIRNSLYDWKLLPIINSKLPIISVGNIQVGGTGKTPFVIALSKQLIANNIRPLIITRGYKRNTNHQIILNNHAQYSVQEVGDEPYYIKQVLKNIPIIIDHNKKNAVKTANALQNIDCIILDDGFQSRYIQKNIDIVLTSFSQINALNLMPVGECREPVSALKRGHFIYSTKDSNLNEKKIKNDFKVIKYEQGVVTFENQQAPLSSVIAFCGIANSKYFITTLKNMNVKIIKEIKFANHAKYNQIQYQQLIDSNPNNLSFITTYKDFVKLNQTFKNKYTIYVLEINFILDDKQLIHEIKQLIHEN